LLPVFSSLSIPIARAKESVARSKEDRAQSDPLSRRTRIYARDLLAAAGLKPDARLSPIEVKVHAKQLSDTGSLI